MFKQMFARKPLETLLAEMKGENRLRRILGPINMTALGIGAIIGAGIFVMTGRAAAVEAGPAIMLSFVVSGIGCVFAAFCYAEFASAVPVAGSAYTYAYATLGEIMGWIIGWDLILEYAMSCATVASAWSEYFNAFLKAAFDSNGVRQSLSSDPFTTPGAIMNVPALLIMVVVTVILVIGIRESATTNAILVGIKVGVVLFVIAVGAFFINPANWTSVPVNFRLTPQEKEIPNIVGTHVKDKEKLSGDEADKRVRVLTKFTRAQYRIDHIKSLTKEQQEQGKMTAAEATEEVRQVEEQYSPDLPTDKADQGVVAELVEKANETKENPAERWGILSVVGINRWLLPIDDSVRSKFMPYGLSGLMLGAAIVFFAYIGFDSISAHSEEAKVPQRDVPFGILASLAICTVLYIAVSAVITGMVKYPDIDQKAAVATAFLDRAKEHENDSLLRASSVLIAAGGLAGMTSVLLITFLSQARIFLAMARDGLLPTRIFAAIHPRFRTPYVSTILIGGIICLLAAFTPIGVLEDMVNIGTLAAFVLVCAAVLVLRIKRPDAERPFRAPWIYLTAPLGIGVNLILMLFLSPLTWLRLVVWLVIGLIIYFLYGMRHSVLGKKLVGTPPELG